MPSTGDLPCLQTNAQRFLCNDGRDVTSAQLLLQFEWVACIFAVVPIISGIIIG